MADRAPTRLRLRSYQVGFGDCYLLSFFYDAGGRPVRNVLIDFGTTAGVETPSKRSLKQIADHIAATCRADGGKLDAVVATHRHADHIAGFGGAAGAVIAGLDPTVIVQPWTEDPRLAPDATGPAPPIGSTPSFVDAMDAMHAIASYSVTELKRLERQKEIRGLTKTVAGQLRDLGTVNIKNEDAVGNLLAMARRRGSRGVFTHFNGISGMENVLPGVRVHVLGPPTLEQSEEIRRQRHSDPDEFWHLYRAAGETVGVTRAERLFPGWPTVRSDRQPPEARWLLPRIKSMRAEQLLGIVRALDRQMNNTSLILLFEAGGKRLLFPGDAQIENWLYVLRDAPARPRNRFRKLLEGVDVYKVGHHGSLNATPKTLWSLFAKRSDVGTGGLQTLMSTRGGFHGASSRGTEVPRSKLVEALEAGSDHFTTQTLRAKADFFRDFDFDL